MIDRIARRAAGFASTTALRWVGAGKDAAAEVVPGGDGDGKGSRTLVTAAAGAMALVASNKTVRAGAERGLLALARAVRHDAPRSSSKGNGSNGNKDLTAKTRAELYELAKKAGLPGRSTMSKDELTKALSR